MNTERKKYEPSAFINRELSWLEFNNRVLEEAEDAQNPVLERLKFFAITSSNLDEFFEIRVAGIKQQISAGSLERSFDGLTPRETFKAITKRVKKLVADQYRCWREKLVPSLEKRQIKFVNIKELDDNTKLWLREYYRREVYPVLTPLLIDPAHPFPRLPNKSLNIIVWLTQNEQNKKPCFAIVPIPKILPRLIKLPQTDSTRKYVFISDLIGDNLENIFPGTTVIGFWRFRITRNSDLYLEEEDVKSLLSAVEKQVQKRLRGTAVRLEIDKSSPRQVRSLLLENLNLTTDDLYLIDGPIEPTSLMILYEDNPTPEARYTPYIAPVAEPFKNTDDIFAVIRKQDVLIHHPYESFSSVVDFLQKAASDDNVIAIKQTLYRTGGDQQIFGALIDAVKKGKQVTAVIELKARFDEEKNIEWARKLEDAGVHVVYGLVGLKVHAKMTLVVRREEFGLRRYLHLSTGNYNPVTATQYCDISLFTCNPDFCEDANIIFNLLTGICQFRGTKKIIVAPFDLHTAMLNLIRNETENAKKKLPARIIAKLNALVDPQIIEALYDASSAGVKIDLIVRGICCLRPGVKGLSENITVKSIVDRYLEHSRIFYFENGLQPKVFLGSADWMPRNFFTRIEVVYPIEDGNIRHRIVNEILKISLSDNVKARVMLPDGKYIRAPLKPGEKLCRSQQKFMELASGISGNNDYSEKTDKKTNSLKPEYQTVKLREKPFSN